jgi:hypothetical protein
MINQKYITLEELMKQVRAELISRLSWAMGQLNGVIPVRMEEGSNVRLYCKKALAEIDGIDETCHECNLEFTAITATRMIRMLKRKDELQGEELKEFAALARDLQMRLEDEMKSITYFTVEASKQRYLDRNPFGELVANAFPSVATDIEEAGKCLVFDRWTAAVFHLSRIAEIATVKICKRVGYASPKEGLGEALRYMDSNLERARKDYEHANPLFKGDLEFLSTVATQMHAVNDAWRRHVSHMDKKYTEEEAIRIWDTTKALMQQLASKLKEETNA